MLVKYGDVVIAIDPFLSGSFFWNGKENVYKGKSPWIGREKMDGFVNKYAKDITAIAITHAHLDHFDPPAIFHLLNKNPDIQILAPYPIIDWLKANSSMNPLATQFLIPVEWLVDYEIESEKNSVHVAIMPNSGIKEEYHPYRVGYLIFKEDGRGIFHPGDSHEIGPWGKYKDKVTDLVLWNPKSKYEIVKYFLDDNQLQSLWWVHWEDFTPGNFSCSEDPSEYVIESEKFGIKSGILDYNKWKSL